MGDAAQFNVDHNTTSIPSSGIFNITAEQFFCSLVKEADVRCISSAQFAGLPLHELCPSGDCWTDCMDLPRLYAPLPTGIAFANETSYGTAPTVTFWNLCNGLANISQAVLGGVPPEEDILPIQSFLSNSTEANRHGVAGAATTCWSDTCSQARNSDDCTPKCAAVNLLESRTVTQLAGTRECIHSVCLNIEGLPFANQDVVGIGVSLSYVIQTFLAILIWAILTFAIVAHRRKSKTATGTLPLSTSWTSFLESILGFHTAQCFFSISLAVAVFFTDPSSLDPLNAFGLLPVALNGLLPVTFTLMMLYHFRHSIQEPLTWYAFLLTDLSYLLNTVILFAVVRYLAPMDTEGIALKESAFQSLGAMDSCGGSTAIALCLATQRDSPPAFLLQQLPNLAFAGIRLAPFVWGICTICIVTTNYRHFRNTKVAESLEQSFLQRDTWERIAPRKFDFASVLRILSGPTLYYVASVAILFSLILQATMFFTYLKLGLVDLQTWSLGQIVSITIWVPPILDYLHLQSGATRERLTARKLARGASGDEQYALTSGLKTYDSRTVTLGTSDLNHDEADCAFLTHTDTFPLEQRPDREQPHIRRASG